MESRKKRTILVVTTAVRLADSANFDLYRRMADPVVMLQLLRDVAQEGVAGMTFRHHQMRGEGSLCGAHRPDVEIVDRLDTR